MSTQKKSALIHRIISNMRFAASELGKPFDAGDVFFSLCFKSDDELQKIANLLGA